jgi:hypothetical protein
MKFFKAVKKFFCKLWFNTKKAVSKFVNWILQSRWRTGIAAFLTFGAFFTFFAMFPEAAFLILLTLLVMYYIGLFTYTGYQVVCATTDWYARLPLRAEVAYIEQ